MTLTVTVLDQGRIDLYQKIFDSDTVPIISPIPIWSNLPVKGRSLCYFLDLSSITDEQRQRLIAHLAQRFNYALPFVEQNLDAYGVPIAAESAIMTDTAPWRWLDFDNPDDPDYPDYPDYEEYEE